MLPWSDLSLTKAIGSPKAKEKQNKTQIVHFKFFWIGKGKVRGETLLYQKHLLKNFYITPESVFYKDSRPDF